MDWDRTAYRDQLADAESEQFRSDCERHEKSGDVAPCNKQMEQLTKQEWKLVNEALALYEASVGDYFTGSALAGREKRLAALRAKVFDQISKGSRA